MEGSDIASFVPGFTGFPGSRRIERRTGRARGREGSAAGPVDGVLGS
jgi:hypothetical protein